MRYLAGSVMVVSSWQMNEMLGEKPGWRLLLDFLSARSSGFSHGETPLHPFFPRWGSWLQLTGSCSCYALSLVDAAPFTLLPFSCLLEALPAGRGHGYLLCPAWQIRVGALETKPQNYSVWNLTGWATHPAPKSCSKPLTLC